MAYQMKKQDKNIRIEVITTDIADLAMMGFGSIRNCEWVSDALAEKYQQVRLSVISTESDLAEVVSRKPDLVFAGIKYVVFSEGAITKTVQNKIWISEYLENAQIPYTGSVGSAIKLDFDKKEAKDQVRLQGIDTADYFIAEPGQMLNEHELPAHYPLFIKPQFESDSKGIDQNSVAFEFAGLQNKIRSIHAELKQAAIIEKYLAGREFTVAILGPDSSGELQVMPVEITTCASAESDQYLGFETKKSNQEILLPVEDENTSRLVSDMARRSFQALGARDFGRIDIKMDGSGKPYFLEANLLPGMNLEHSYFPLACSLCKGLSYRALVQRMAEIALDRCYGH